MIRCAHDGCPAAWDERTGDVAAWVEAHYRVAHATITGPVTVEVVEVEEE